MANWWDAPKYGQNYNNWWTNLFKTEGLNQNPDVNSSDSPYNPAKDASGFFKYLVDPSGEGGQYGVMSPYQFRSGANQAENWYDNFLTETLANMQNTDNQLGNVVTTEDFAKYMKARMNPSGYQSGTALGVPGSATAGQTLQPGFTYSPEQSQAMTRQALQNMIDAYGTYQNKSNVFKGFGDVYSAANSQLNVAYNTALGQLKAAVGPVLDAAHGYTDANLRTLLGTGTVKITNPTTGVVSTLTLTGQDPQVLSGVKAMFGSVLPASAGSTTAAPKDAYSLDTSAFTSAGTNEPTVRMYAKMLDSITGQTSGGLVSALDTARDKAQAAGYTMNGVDYGNVLAGIAAGNNMFEGKYNAWAPNSAEQTAQSLMQAGTTGSPDSNRLYQMLWTGLGGGYGGAFRNALQNQFRGRVNALTDTMAGNGGSYLDQLRQLFNAYAARQGAY
jgi:hypothetical protein